jgi:hypothetical protein
MTMETLARILLVAVIAIGALAVALLLAARRMKRAAREHYQLIGPADGTRGAARRRK